MSKTLGQKILFITTIFLIICVLVLFAYIYSATKIVKTVSRGIHDPYPVDINKIEKMQRETENIPSLELPEQKIPRTIIQTNAFSDVSGGIFLSIDRLKKFNPEYKHIYFNDQDCEDFIQENFDERTFSAYSTIVPGAFKSDFFRCCYLLKKGGVYLDTGFISLVPLREIIGKEDVFISPEDNNTSHYLKPGHKRKNKIFYLYNAMMASIPGNPILVEYLRLMIENIESRNYTRDALTITGPGCLGEAFVRVMKFFEIGHFKTRIGMVRILKNLAFFISSACLILIDDKPENLYRPLFYTKNLSYRSEQRKQKRPYYVEYYKQHQVFGEPGPLPVKFEKNRSKNENGKKIKSFAYTYPRQKGKANIKTYIPAKIRLIYDQKIPKNIIQFGDSEIISKNTFMSIMTFLYLNPEYDYYYSTEKDPDKRQEFVKEKGGIILKLENIAALPLRDFIDPEAEKIILRDETGKEVIFGISKEYSNCGKEQVLKKKTISFSSVPIITDEKEYVGVNDRICIYDN